MGAENRSSLPHSPLFTAYCIFSTSNRSESDRLILRAFVAGARGSGVEICDFEESGHAGIT